MNWNQLQYVITIAMEKNITRAAKKLYISQPSLTLSIKALEKELGVILFERNHGNISLTYGGKLFYEWALSTLHSNRQLTLKLNDISNQSRHLIRLGISPHRSNIILPDVLEHFYKEYPACELHVTEKPTYILKKMLENNSIDLIIDVAHPDTVNYQSDLLINESIMIAIPKTFISGYPSIESYIDLKQLLELPFIMLSEDQILGSMSRKICESANFYPDIRMITSNIETALMLASRQIGITFVPEIFSVQKRFSSKIQYASIRDFHTQRQICLVYHKNLYQCKQLSALIRLFREMIPNMYQ